MSKKGFFDFNGKDDKEPVEQIATQEDGLKEETASTDVVNDAVPPAAETPSADADNAGDDKKKYYLEDGTECSKSAFIREQFTKNNLSRKEISEKFDIPYRTVYGATVNMENAAEPTTRGRGVTFSKINVTAAGKLVTVKDGVVFINGEEQPKGTVAPETEEVDRNTWIKEQVARGVERGAIAKMLDLSYGVIYGLTKDANGTRQKYEVELPDGTKISRSEYIRQQVAAGIPKAEIAKALGVEYSVVWQATKKLKTTDEKFADAVNALEKFIDQVEDPEALRKIIDSLGAVKIKAEEVDKVSEEAAAPEAK